MVGTGSSSATGTPAEITPSISLVSSPIQQRDSLPPRPNAPSPGMSSDDGHMPRTHAPSSPQQSIHQTFPSRNSQDAAATTSNHSSSPRLDLTSIRPTSPFGTLMQFSPFGTQSHAAPVEQPRPDSVLEQAEQPSARSPTTLADGLERRLSTPSASRSEMSLNQGLGLELRTTSSRSKSPASSPSQGSHPSDPFAEQSSSTASRSPPPRSPSVRSVGSRRSSAVLAGQLPVLSEAMNPRSDSSAGDLNIGDVYPFRTAANRSSIAHSIRSNSSVDELSSLPSPLSKPLPVAKSDASIAASRERPTSFSPVTSQATHTSLIGTAAPTTPKRQSLGLQHSNDSYSRNNVYPQVHQAYGMLAEPYSWDTMDGKEEDDDYLHDGQEDDSSIRASVGRFPVRAFLNIGALAILIAAVLMLFAGYPIIRYGRYTVNYMGGANLGGTNFSGQIPMVAGFRTSLIDSDTPSTAYTHRSLDGKTMQLVFSDEFEQDGRSFYPGDDPFWEAVDLHYWGTNDLEWYDPQRVTTANGSLQIRFDQIENHNLPFRSGMLQSWNKLCFTGGYIEVSVRLPGFSDVPGLWPAVWTMGNLGRAGYGSTLEGLWPYSYETCDVGTLANQTDPSNNQPATNAYGGDTIWNAKHNTESISWAVGQRLSACTCPSDDHPGPKLSNGQWQGRSAPEIDIFEAQVTGKGVMQASQSAQVAPFNQFYKFSNSTGPAYTLFQDTEPNLYTGEITQQAASGVVSIDPQTASQFGTYRATENGLPNGGGFSTYAYEYTPGTSGSITWYSGGAPSWTLNQAAMDPDPISKISRRPISNEPMSIIMNLGMSKNWGSIDFTRLKFPAVMSVDYVRIYQPADKINVGCDPEDYPTTDYINRHYEAYTNPNMTIWGGTAETGGYGADWPRNNMYLGGCSAPVIKAPGSSLQPLAKAPYFRSSVIGNDANAKQADATTSSSTTAGAGNAATGDDTYDTGTTAAGAGTTNADGTAAGTAGNGGTTANTGTTGNTAADGTDTTGTTNTDGTAANAAAGAAAAADTTAATTTKKSKSKATTAANDDSYAADDSSYYDN